MKNSKNRKKNLRTKSGLTLKGKIVVFSVLFILVIATIITLLLTLPQFTLNQINVYGLVKVEEEEILSKANLELGKNIFLQKYFTAEANIENIKIIKDAQVKFKLPDNINISINEREEIYQIEFSNMFYIIDDQGYLLKEVDKKDILPVISGIEAKFENGIRLEESELLKLESINKIYNTTKVLNIDGMVSNINLKTTGFDINFASNKKIAHFESINNLMNSMQFVREILRSDEEKNKSGDIYASEEGARFKSK